MGALCMILTLNSPKDLVAQIEQLILIEPRFSPIYARAGVPDLRRQKGGFSQLMRAIVGQQLSVAAANSIWEKLDQSKLISAHTVNQATDDTLRSHGLSKQKIRYIRSLIAHDIDFDSLKQLPDDEVIKTLTAVTGIGVWTAEMYMLFSLGRADILAVDDLAVKVSIMDLLNLTTRPTAKQLTTLTSHWSPYRSAASLLLWEHYGWLKDRDAVPM